MVAENFFHPTQEQVDQAIQFRSKRDVKRQSSYKLHSQYENITPFGIFGKVLSNLVNQVKKKNPQS